MQGEKFHKLDTYAKANVPWQTKVCQKMMYPVLGYSWKATMVICLLVLGRYQTNLVVDLKGKVEGIYDEPSTVR